jgi:YegS/Rv2252/BmrU family lipid kinase
MPDAAVAAPPLAPAVRASVSVILNHAAGSGSAGDGADDLQRKLEALGVRADIVAIEPGGDVRAAVESALRRRPDAVIAGGGDGTVSAVAACVAGTDMPMGVLPLGTLNHFAKDLGVPTELEPALEMVARGRVARVDVAEVNGHVFVNNSSLGLYPEIVRDRDLQCRQYGRGKWAAMLSASVRAFERNQPMWLHIEVDGQTLVRRTGFVFIGNNEYTMSGLHIGERPTIRDGRLSLYVTRRTGRMAMVRLAFQALLGRLQQAEDFEAMEAATVVVRTARQRVRVATDGEVQLMDTPLHYRIRPAALRVLLPA